MIQLAGKRLAVGAAGAPRIEVLCLCLQGSQLVLNIAHGQQELHHRFSYETFLDLIQ